MIVPLGRDHPIVGGSRPLPATDCSTTRRAPRSRVVDAFAAGAILTMLADTMMPEAFAYGGRQVGLLTTLGFSLAVGIAVWEHVG